MGHMLLYLYSGVTVRVRILRTDLSILATSENDWMLLKRVRLPALLDPPTALGISYKLPLTMTVTNGNREPPLQRPNFGWHLKQAGPLVSWRARKQLPRLLLAALFLQFPVYSSRGLPCR